MAAAAETAASIFGALGRTALAGLADLAAGMAGPTTFLGVLFLPANSSLVTEDKLPDRPDLSYRYDRDTGILEIFRQSDGGRQLAASGHLGADGLFYGADGEVIGRGLGSTAAVDPGALPAPAGEIGAQAGAVVETAQDRPQLCPAASDENIAGRSERSIAYQTQITGLPPGLEVKLIGVRFDGCRETDGTMLEAKGSGFADKMTGPAVWPDWYRFVDQAKEQDGSAIESRARSADRMALRRA